jgi:hypothetical protein
MQETSSRTSLVMQINLGAILACIILSLGAYWNLKEARRFKEFSFISKQHYIWSFFCLALAIIILLFIPF